MESAWWDGPPWRRRGFGWSAYNEALTFSISAHSQFVIPKNKDQDREWSPQEIPPLAGTRHSRMDDHVAWLQNEMDVNKSRRSSGKE